MRMKINKKENMKNTAEWAERKRNAASKEAFHRKAVKYLNSQVLIMLYA